MVYSLFLGIIPTVRPSCPSAEWIIILPLLPDLKADLSEENLLALASSSCNSSDDLGLKRDDDASKLSDFSAALEKSKLTKHLMTTATGSRRISDFTIRSSEGAPSPIR